MSRARKVKKAGRYFEWCMEDKHGEFVMWHGCPSERESRLDRMDSKRHMGMGWGWLKPVPVKHRR